MQENLPMIPVFSTNPFLESSPHFPHTGVGKINATPPKNTLHKRLHKTTHNTSNNIKNRVFKGTNTSKDVKKVVIYYPVVALCF